VALRISYFCIKSVNATKEKYHSGPLLLAKSVAPTSGPRHGSKIGPLWVQPADHLFQMLTPPGRECHVQIEPLWVQPAERLLQMLTPPGREGHFTPPQSKNRLLNVSLVRSFCQGLVSLRRNIVENLVISLEVSSAILTCQTSPAGSMVFMSALQVPSEKLNSPP